jgi:glycosyltransferase involved in cell wall biosynthesis
MGIVAEDHETGVPDVSVIVAVYNTMPYLTRCLTSLVEQSIGTRRMQIIAVDDGSTDGSPAELAAFAKRYPHLITVITQANSGGPAAPSNRGLDVATGRYVFFSGADDYLGREALERLVAAADECDSDVVAGRMVGDSGRYVPQDIFSQTNYDVDLFNSTLPFAVSNTKLFRRSMIEEHGIRYPEDLPFGSDQPFTVAACVHAKRISVLSDYDYYYAVKRRGRENITYQASHELRLWCTGRIMEATAALLEPGPQRDAVMRRSFASELSKLTRADFRKLDRDVQERIGVGIGKLADRFLTDGIRETLDASRRVRISLAQYGYIDDLISVVRQNAAKKHPPLVVDDGRLYLAYQCFRDERDLPDAWFFVSDDPAELIARQIDVRSTGWRGRRVGRDALVISAVSPTDQAEMAAAGLRVTIGGVDGQLFVKEAKSGSGTSLRIQFPMRQLMSECPKLGGRKQMIADVSVNGTAFHAPLRVPSGVSRPRRLATNGLRPYFVRPIRQPDGELAIEFWPASAGDIMQSLRRRLRIGARLRALRS